MIGAFGAIQASGVNMANDLARVIAIALQQTPPTPITITNGNVGSGNFAGEIARNAGLKEGTAEYNTFVSGISKAYKATNNNSTVMTPEQQAKYAQQ